MTTASQLGENSHRGFDGIKAALCLGAMQAKSNTTSGMALRLRQNGIGSRCTGKERDAETALDYFGARYFSAAEGRFTSPDPGAYKIEDPRTFNRYAYVNNKRIGSISCLPAKNSTKPPPQKLQIRPAYENFGPSCLPIY